MALQDDEQVNHFDRKLIYNIVVYRHLSKERFSHSFIF